MRSLLDVNVLIALLDPDHASHDTALGWFANHAWEGWASCPITQNGCIRIMAAQGYPNPLPVQAVMKHLADACADAIHEFWPDEVSLLDPAIIDSTRVHGPRQLTDTYLLALAVRHEGRLLTFDRSIQLTAIRNASARNLLVL
jgi:toxin-antitoxin system PIN domain toxin